MPPDTHRRLPTLVEAWQASGGPMTMIEHDDTPSTATGDQRIRRLRALIAVMIDRYGDDGPMVATIRRNLAHAEADRAEASAGQEAPR